MANDDNSINLPLDMAQRYLAYQPRTILEVMIYLAKKGFGEDIIEKIINILLEKNFLNDHNFAQLFVESRVKTKPKSKFALGYELKKKGVNASIIEDVLSQYDDEDLALSSVKSKIKIWQNLDPEKFKKKMLNFLRYRGFSYDICLSTLNCFTKDE